MIDVQTYPVQVSELLDRDSTLAAAVSDVFGLFMPPQPLATYIGHLDEAEIDLAVIHPLDCSTSHGTTVVSNQQIAWLMEQTDRVIGLASVDPNNKDAAETLKRDVAEYGMIGVKLDPALQRFDIDDKDLAYPVYEAARDLGLPVFMQCGISWAAAGLSALGHPLKLEPVLHEFPDLAFVIPQLGWPWVEEAVMLAIKHRNVYLDTSVLFSGTPSESFKWTVETKIGHELIDRSMPRQILFGSSYPRADPKRGAWAVSEMNFRPKLEDRIFDGNARELLIDPEAN